MQKYVGMLNSCALAWKQQVNIQHVSHDCHDQDRKMNTIHKYKARVPEWRMDTACTRSQAVNKHDSLFAEGVSITGIKATSFGYTIQHCCTYHSVHNTALKHYTSHKNEYCTDTGCIVHWIHKFGRTLQEMAYCKQVTSQDILQSALHVEVSCKMWSHFCL